MREIAQMFPERWQKFENCGSAFTQREPLWRALAFHKGRVVGHIGLVDLDAGLVGMSDWVTCPDFSNRGVARFLGGQVVRWAGIRGSSLLVDTENGFLRGMLQRWGFSPPDVSQVVLLNSFSDPVPSGWLLWGEVSGRKVHSLF